MSARALNRFDLIKVNVDSCGRTLNSFNFDARDNKVHFSHICPVWRSINLPSIYILNSVKQISLHCFAHHTCMILRHYATVYLRNAHVEIIILFDH